ncbi:MAG: tRNA 2-thiouridine(34) synthase MnmA [Candidatus Kryptoniota bacterium]
MNGNGVHRPRVLVAMSGGVDSSVAAALMVEQGYDVIGATIKTYNYEDVGGNENLDTSCCSLDGINMARSVASKFNFPHYVFDFSDRFKMEVINEFISEYLAGRTPNPCVICNQKVKWEYLIEKANSLEADYICTGHYAKLRFNNETKRFVISRGADAFKDQSYALYRLTQESLSKTLFPLAEMTKPEVRGLAEKYGLASAKKPESYEICFVADNDYARFLRDAVPQLGTRLANGEIMMNGTAIGKHPGYAFYTIGQRKGLGISYEKPLYVKGIDAINNIIDVDVDENLYAKGLIAEQINMVKSEDISQEKSFKGKIRYKDTGAPCTVRKIANDKIKVMFDEPRRAVTPGQSIVLYDGEDVEAGGIITTALT